MRILWYMIASILLISSSITLSDNHDAFLFIVKYQGPDGTFAGAYGTLDQGNGVIEQRSAHQSRPDQTSSTPQSCVSVMYETQDNSGTKRYESNIQECQPAFRAITKQQQAVNFQSIEQAQQYYTLVTTQQEATLNGALESCQAAANKIDAVDAMNRSINTTYYEQQTTEKSSSNLVTTTPQTHTSTAPQQASSSVGTSTAHTPSQQAAYEKITGNTPPVSTKQETNITPSHIPTPEIDSNIHDYQPHPCAHNESTPAISDVQVQSGLVILYLIGIFIKDPKKFLEDAKKEFLKTLDFLKFIKDTCIDGYKLCKQVIKAFIKWVKWLFRDDSIQNNKSIQFQEKESLEESYKKNIEKSCDKLIAIKTVQHIATLLETCHTGTQEEQFLAQMHLFRISFPCQFSCSIHNGLEKLAQKCFDKKGNFHAIQCSKTEIETMFEDFYQKVLPTPLKVYATIDDAQFTLCKNNYKKNISDTLYKTVSKMLNARIRQDIFDMHAIKEQCKKQPIIQDLYFKSINSLVKETNNGSIIPWCAHNDRLFDAEEHARTQGAGNDIILARNYFVEEFWPYLGADGQTILDPLYEILPNDETIFHLKDAANYRITTTKNYVTHVVKNHPQALSNQGILKTFAQHPFITKHFTPDITPDTTLLEHTNFALLISNMYQDHQTQELAHQLLQAAYDAHTSDNDVIKQTAQLHAQTLYEILQDKNYTPAFYTTRPVTPEVIQAYANEIPERIGTQYDWPRNEARLQTINEQYLQQPYSAQLTELETTALEEHAISPWQFEHIYATTLQAQLYDECHHNITSYTQQPDELTASINVLSLKFTDVAASYIRNEQFEAACNFLNASYAGLHYSAQVAAVYMKAVGLGLTDTLDDIADLGISASELVIAAWNNPTQAKQDCIDAFATIINFVGAIAYDLSDDPLTKVVKYSNALYEHARTTGKELYHEYSTKSGPERVRAITHLISKQYVTFKGTTALTKFAHKAVASGMQKVGLEAHTLFAAKQGQLGLALTGKKLSSPMYSFVQRFGNATITGLYHKAANLRKKWTSAISYYTKECKKKINTILRREQEQPGEKLIPINGEGNLFPEVMVQAQSKLLPAPELKPKVTKVDTTNIEINGITDIPAEPYNLKKGGINHCKLSPEESLSIQKYYKYFFKNIADKSNITKQVFAPLRETKKILKHQNIPIDGLKHRSEIICKLESNQSGSRIDVKLQGFHHDYNNYIENSPYVALIDKTEHAHGVTEAYLAVGGMVTRNKKTFYPSHEHPATIAKWVHEASLNRIMNNPEPNSKLDMYIGQAKNGMNVSITKSKTTGAHISDYPITCTPEEYFKKAQIKK